MWCSLPLLLRKAVPADRPNSNMLNLRQFLSSPNWVYAKKKGKGGMMLVLKLSGKAKQVFRYLELLALNRGSDTLEKIIKEAKGGDKRSSS